jgi:hypothetical protein
MSNFVWAVNELHSNVWSVLLIGAAVILIIKGHNQEGLALLTGAFGVFKSGGSDANHD